ncbi:unnamed protein product, partial [Adineta steineri]
AKLTSDSNRLTVYRGVKLDLSAQYEKGSTVTWWGFSSCTTSIHVLSNKQYLGQSGTRTLFAIDCSTAKSIQKYSFFPVEEEVLLPPARQFQVKASLNSGNDLHIIQLKELEPKFPLINPVPQPTPHPPIPLMHESTSIPDSLVPLTYESTSLPGPLIQLILPTKSFSDSPIPPIIEPTSLTDTSTPRMLEPTSLSDPPELLTPPKYNNLNLQ